MRGADWKPSLSDPEVHEYLSDEVGEEAFEVAEYLRDHMPVSGVEILEHFGDRKPSDVRKVLYRLMEAHAAEYSKDTDKSGWETFTWDLDLPEIGLILRRRWKEELANLRKQLRFEDEHEFYSCDHKHRRMSFEDAMDLQFRCPVCQEPMQPMGNEHVKEALRGRIAELEPAFAS